MRKTLFLVLASYIFFVLEFVLFNSFGWWAKPNLMLVLVLFTCVYWDVRWGMLAALLGGLWYDMCEINFGLNMVAMGLCVLVIAFLAEYIYQRGSRASFIILLFFVLLANVFVRWFLWWVIGQDLPMGVIFSRSLVESLVTLLLANMTLNGLIRCASKLFV